MSRCWEVSVQGRAGRLDEVHYFLMFMRRCVQSASIKALELHAVNRYLMSPVFASQSFHREDREGERERCRNMQSAVQVHRRGYWPSERTFNMALLGFCRHGGNTGSSSKATNWSNLNRVTATVPCLRQGKWLLATTLLQEMRRSEIQFSPLECKERVLPPGKFHSAGTLFGTLTSFPTPRAFQP